MFNILKVSLFLLMMMQLVACSKVVGEHGIIHNKTENYLESRNGVTLKAPSHLSATKLSSHFIIPSNHAKTEIAPLPPGSSIHKAAHEKRVSHE